MLDNILESQWYDWIVLIALLLGIWGSVISVRQHYFPSNNKAIERYKRKFKREKNKRKASEEEFDTLRTILDNLSNAAQSDPSLKGVLRKARLALSRGNPELLTSLETEHLKARKPDNAEQAREFSERFQELASLDKKLGNRYQAIDHLLSAKEYTPDDPNIWCDLGELYYWEQKFKEADKAFSHGIALIQNPQAFGSERLAEVYQLAGDTKLTLGELDRAVELFEKALAIETSTTREASWITPLRCLRNL